MTSHDFRALCAELVTAYDKASEAVDFISDCLDLDAHHEHYTKACALIHYSDALLLKARAALEQGQQGAPTDEVLP